MNAQHIKYTVEFDLPIKIDGYTVNPQAFDMIDALITQAIKAQNFYFRKEKEPYFIARAKNINLSHTSEIKTISIDNL
jgi:hypothetical protein